MELYLELLIIMLSVYAGWITADMFRAKLYYKIYRGVIVSIGIAIILAFIYNTFGW